MNSINNIKKCKSSSESAKEYSEGQIKMKMIKNYG
jgi:hypothetical protein